MPFQVFKTASLSVINLLKLYNTCISKVKVNYQSTTERWLLTFQRFQISFKVLVPYFRKLSQLTQL